MKYFVTGATGFIGGRVARQLLSAGHEVIMLARTPSKAQALVAMGVKVHAGDLTDKESLRAPMAGVDGVFHIAAWYKVGARDTSQAETINVGGTRNVLEMMKELGIPRGVYTSTLTVFSDTRGQMVDESYQYTGTSFLSEYDRTKWKAHYEVARPLMQAGLPLVIVQPGLVYGPGDTSVVHEAWVNYLRGKLPMTPSGSTYCWGYVDDTAHGHILAADLFCQSERFHHAVLWPGNDIALADVAPLHGQDMPVCRVIHIPPAIRCAAGRHGELPAQIGHPRLVNDAGVARSIDQPWLDNHQWESGLHQRPRHFVMRPPLRAIILTQKGGAGVLIALIHHLPPGIGEDRQRASIDALGDAQFLHHLQHVARATHVDRLGLARIPRAHFIPGGNMKDAIYARHRCAQAFFVGNIARVHLDTQGHQRLRLGWRARQRDDLMPCREQLPRHTPANKAGGARHKIFHGTFTSLQLAS